MKKVWILEKLYKPEETLKSISDMEEILRTAPKNPAATEEGLEMVKKAISSLQQKLEDYPEGYWLGFEGKTVYSQFCSVAKAALRRHPTATFRVVKAEIEDDAQFWPGYKNPQVNEGVLRYLMATK